MVDALTQNGGFVIPIWEVILYVAIVSVYAFLGRTASLLLNTFAFTFYWGFMYLLSQSFSLTTNPEPLLMLYVLCGLGVYVLATASIGFDRSTSLAFPSSLFPPVSRAAPSLKGSAAG